MSSRARWIAALCVAFGAAIAISFWPENNDGAAMDGASAPAIPVEIRNGAERANEVRGEGAEDLARNVAPSPDGQQAVGEPVDPSTTPTAGGERLQGFPPDRGFTQTARKFESESKDPTWSDTAGAQILGKLSRMTYLEAVYLEVDCRTTMCRIAIAPRDFPPPSWQLSELVYKLGLSVWQLQQDRRTILTYLPRDRLILVDPPNDPFAR